MVLGRRREEQAVLERGAKKGPAECLPGAAAAEGNAIGETAGQERALRAGAQEKGQVGGNRGREARGARRCQKAWRAHRLSQRGGGSKGSGLGSWSRAPQKEGSASCSFSLLRAFCGLPPVWRLATIPYNDVIMTNHSLPHSSGLMRTTRVPGALLLPVPSRLRLELELRGVCWRSTACISAHVRLAPGGAAREEKKARGHTSVHVRRSMVPACDAWRCSPDAGHATQSRARE